MVNRREAVRHAAALRHAFQTSGAKGDWKEYLALELRSVNEPNQYGFGKIDIAEGYARQGDKDKAFAWLEKATRREKEFP